MKRFFTVLVLAGVVAGFFLVLPSNSSMQLSGASPLGLDMSTYLLEDVQDSSQLIDSVEALGVSSLKISIPWQEVELSAGLFNWSIRSQGNQIDLADLLHQLDQKGIALTIILDGFPAYLQYENLSETSIVENYLESWERYVQAVVAQFGDSVDSWQIGQVINMPMQLQDDAIAAAILSSPPTYAERLKIASDIIKEADKSDLVILGGIRSDTGNCLNQPSAFLYSIYMLDAWDAFDVIGIDLDTYAIAPEGNSMYQTYDSAAGVCLTSAEEGFNLAEILALVDGVNSQFGAKPIWITALAWQEDDLSAIAEERGTLPDVVRSDFLSRASVMLLGRHNVANIYWTYTGDAEGDTSLGVFSLQVFKNLSASLQGFLSTVDVSDIYAGYYQYRLTTSSAVQIFVWRTTGGDQFLPFTLQNVAGYTLEAYALDAESIKKGKGIELNVGESGETAFMLNERPVLVKAIPSDLKERLSLYLQGLFTSASQSIKNSTEDILETQKEKASQQVEEWVDEQKDSLFEMLKESLLEWLQEALNLDQFLQ